MDVTLEPGEGHAFHRHDGQEEMIIVKRGAITQYLERESTTLGPGDSVYIDDGVVHASYNDGDETAHLQVVIGRRSARAATGSSTSPARSPGRRSLCAQRRAAASSVGASTPRIDASTSSIGWNAGSGRPARRSAARDLERQPGCRSRRRPARSRGTCSALRSPSSRRGLGLDDVVDAGAAAADLLLGRLEQRQAGDRARARRAARLRRRCACRRWHESWNATRSASGCRSARGAGAGSREQLRDVDDVREP